MLTEVCMRDRLSYKLCYKRCGDVRGVLRRLTEMQWAAWLIDCLLMQIERCSARSLFRLQHRPTLQPTGTWIFPPPPSPP